MASSKLTGRRKRQFIELERDEMRMEKSSVLSDSTNDTDEATATTAVKATAAGSNHCSNNSKDATTQSSLSQSVKRLKVLAEEFQKKLEEAPELKQAEELYQTLVKAIELPEDDIDGILRLAQVQRTTIKALIRPIVKRLSSSQACVALRRLLDNRLMTGLTFQSVDPRHRQVWVRELVRVFPREVNRRQFKQELKGLAINAHRTIGSQHAMGKVYGRLTTVLDQQYRQKLKEGKDVDKILMTTTATTPTTSRDKGVGSTMVTSHGNLGSTVRPTGVLAAESRVMRTIDADSDEASLSTEEGSMALPGSCEWDNDQNNSDNNNSDNSDDDNKSRNN